MNSMCMKAATAAMVLTAGSAVTLGAWQQNGTATTTVRPTTTTQPGATQPGTMSQTPRAGVGATYAADYRSASKLKGNEIADWNNEEVGTIEDMVVDRGSGQITHVVVKSGTLLGMGGRSVMIPYREFQWDSSKGRLMLNTTDVGDFPAYTADSWKSMRTSTRPTSNWRNDRDRWNDTNRVNDQGRKSQPANEPRAQNTGDGATNSPTNRDPRGASPQQQWSRGSSEEAPPLNDWMWDQNRPNSDPYASNWSGGASQRIEGEIKRVDRQYTSNGEQVVLEIQTSDGKTQRVAVGPSWYVSGGDTTYNRGDRVTVDAVPMYVARTATVNGKEFKYRDDQGKPAWSGDSFAYGGATYSAPSYRNMLLSELKSAKLDCRGAGCGKVDDVVLEMNSGMVAFLSIDPDQNFLGIADTKRLAPWGVVSIGADGRARVDAQKDMMLSTAKTPDDITSLNRSGEVDTIYNAYQVPARDYDRWRDEDSNYRYEWRREREMWRRNQNYQESVSNPDAKKNPPAGSGPQQPR